MYRRHDGKLIVSATDLVGYLACGHLTQLERAAAAGLIRRPVRQDPAVELLRRRGGQHEQRYLGRLEADGRRITNLAADNDVPLETRAQQTTDAMRRGDDVIFQATVFDGRWRGHPDFLMRVGEPGQLGKDHHYEVADTKLAHSAKASALIQICSYVDQVEQVQGMRLEKVYVVTGGAEIAIHPFRTAEMMAFYRHAKACFEEALDEAASGAPVWPIDRATSYPDPVEHCAVCRWYADFCRRQWLDDDALKLVAGISRTQRQVLTKHSVTTMRGLSQLTQPLELDLKRAQNDSMWRMREQARLQVASAGSSIPFFELLDPEQDPQGSVVADRGLSALPEPSAGDLFFDIEGDPFAFWEGLEYLFGIWGDGAYQGFWALDREAEKLAFEQVIDLFIGRLMQDPNMHVYHYAPYEPTALKRLAGRHATREEELDQLLRGRVFVDLYRVVRQGARVGAERYSIKNLEPLYGYTREIELRDANSSIVEFEKVLEMGDPGGNLKEQIRLYNRDDCISTERLRDWLEQRRPEAAAHLGIDALPRPAPGEQQASEELTAREQAVRDLEDKLTAGIPRDPADRTSEQQATWLLAQLIDWHRRENKSTWWRFYDLLTKSDDELLEEKEPISGLRYEAVVRETRQSLVHRYRFPVQEHGIDPGNEVHDPQLPGGATRTGTVDAIDDEGGTIDIKRRRSWAGTHPTSVVPLNVYGADAQKAALMRIGQWAADQGIDPPGSAPGPYRAARDLLLRRAPRGGQPDGEALVREGETGTHAARRLAPTLDATTLSIQGPPGSGKTYSGARMIVDLVRAGRSVGITANSHKVISNLLDEVCAAADEARVAVRGMQKVDGEDAVDHASVRLVKDNAHVERALLGGEVDVVGGTPWLWARGELAGLLDTLFVDEAGQMSLANVVAVSGAARNVVLLGDPQQLDQPLQGVHPTGADRSALAHFLGEDETVPADKGVFLERTWRLHPLICDFTSQLFYEDRLEPVDGLEGQRVLGEDDLSGAGVRWMPVHHEGNTNDSPQEAERVAEIVRALVGRTYVDAAGVGRPIRLADILIVSPFNAHRLRIRGVLGPQARVGTVDKFQGQEAPVSIYTMATSRPEDAPRGLGFLYSLHRLNVATSRARALAIVVASPALLTAVPRTPEQLRMANGLCAFVEAATASS